MDKELITYVGKLCPREVELLVCTWSSRHIKVHIKLLDEHTIHGRNPTWFFQVWAIIGYIVSDLACPSLYGIGIWDLSLVIVTTFLILSITVRAGLHRSQVTWGWSVQSQLLREWKLGLTTSYGSQVLSLKYDMDAYMAICFGGEAWDLCWELSQAKS
jgi:hypothetical protein